LPFLFHEASAERRLETVAAGLNPDDKAARNLLIWL
jgi:hypothetical protein